MPRNPNDSETVSGVFTQLGVQLPQNTAFAAEGGTVLVNNDDAIYQYAVYSGAQQTAPLVWPVLLIQENGQKTKRHAVRVWKISELYIRATLMLPWQPQTMTLNTIWANFGADLRLMQANIEDSPRLVDTGGAQHAERVNEIVISKRFDQALNQLDYGFSVVRRWLDLTIELPPYNSLR